MPVWPDGMFVFCRVSRGTSAVEKQALVGIALTGPRQAQGFLIALPAVTACAESGPARMAVRFTRETARRKKNDRRPKACDKWARCPCHERTASHTSWWAWRRLGGIVTMTGKSAPSCIVSVCVQERFVVLHVKHFLIKNIFASALCCR